MCINKYIVKGGIFMTKIADELMTEENIRKVYRALDRLDQLEHDVLLMLYYYEHSKAVVAALFSSPIKRIYNVHDSQP